MCGIAGVAEVGKEAGSLAIVDSIVASQRLRGPDHTGDERFADDDLRLRFGHNRLKIIDLSDASNQPMWDADRACCLVFNGEVYNYVEIRSELRSLGRTFRTEGDVEVILEAYRQWGIEAVSRFNGMFAFALYDALRHKLWLVRDRFGVKPLYYVCDGDRLAFASTTRAIAQHFRLEPNLAYVRRGIDLGVFEDDTDFCAYVGLHALRPGHLAEARLDARGRIAVENRPYYDLESRVEATRGEVAGALERDLVDRVRSGLEDAIRLRLRSDVRVGVSLSGGLDSSSLAAIVARSNPGLVGVTFGHPDDRATEGPLVAMLARHAGIDVAYVAPSPSEIVEGFDAALEAQDAPFASGSIVAQHFVFRESKARGLTVMLGGQGGDEAFMGYRKYLWFTLRDLLRRRRYAQFAAASFTLAPTAVAEIPGIPNYWRHRDRYSGRSTGTDLRLPGDAPAGLGLAPGEPVWKRQMQDVLRWSLPTLLRYEDRNSMGASVESRLPFLDYRLMELGLALRDRLKVRGGYGKWVLREAMRGLVPDEIRLARYKRGFDVDLARWLAAGFGRALRSRVAERQTMLASVLPDGFSVEGRFSDEQLLRRRAAFVEAVSLIWLGSRLA